MQAGQGSLLSQSQVSSAIHSCTAVQSQWHPFNGENSKRKRERTAHPSPTNRDDSILRPSGPTAALLFFPPSDVVVGKAGARLMGKRRSAGGCKDKGRAGGKGGG